MKPQIRLITIMTDNIKSMLKFYKNVMGFTCDEESGNYMELNHDGIKIALCPRSLMYDLSKNVKYKESVSGQRFELAFWLPTKDDVDSTYKEIVDKGAIAIMEPHNMPWGQRTAMFADPDGNIHEIYAD